MEKLKLNLKHIQQLAENNAELDGLTYAMIQDATEIFLAYNKHIKALCIYWQDDEPICRVQDLVETTGKLARNDEELYEQMNFAEANTPIEDAVKWLIQEVKHEKLVRTLNA